MYEVCKRSTNLITIYLADLQFHFNARGKAELPVMIEKNSKRYVELFSMCVDQIMEEVKTENELQLKWEDLTGDDIRVSDL